MLNRQKGITLQYQIEDSIRAKLESLSFGAKIESEDELAQLYGVSRGTIRQAVIQLVNQGLLYRVHGKGTYKSVIAFYDSGVQITSLTDQLIKDGFNPGIKDVEISTELSTKRVCDRLGLCDNESVWKITRTRLANEYPISFNIAYLRKDLIPQLVPSDLEMSLINMITKKFGFRLVKSENFCSAILANKYLSTKLSIKVGSPILHLEHVAYGTEGKPIFLDISNVNGNRYVQRFEQIGYL